jgi:small subunit ribosomal protein S6
VREYEFTFVVQPELSDEGVDAISTRFEGVLAGGSSEKLYYEDWGRRRLAYEIKNFQKGHYRVLHFLSDGQVIPELERAARLDDSVLRFLTVLVEEDVDDADDRRAEAVKLEEERVKRAAERAEREAEEAARAAEDAANRAANDEARDDDDDSSDDNGSRDDDDGDDDDDNGDDEKEE